MDVLIKTFLLCFNMLYSPPVQYTPKLRYVTIVKGFKTKQHGAALLVKSAALMSLLSNVQLKAFMNSVQTNINVRKWRGEKRKQKRCKNYYMLLFTYTETWRVHNGTDNRIIFSNAWPYQQPLAVASVHSIYSTQMQFLHSCWCNRCCTSLKWTWKYLKGNFAVFVNMPKYNICFFYAVVP